MHVERYPKLTIKASPSLIWSDFGGIVYTFTLSQLTLPPVWIDKLTFVVFEILASLLS